VYNCQQLEFYTRRRHDVSGLPMYCIAHDSEHTLSQSDLINLSIMLLLMNFLIESINRHRIRILHKSRLFKCIWSVHTTILKFSRKIVDFQE